MKRQAEWLNLSLAAALLCAPLLAGTARADAAVDLSGTWRLDQSESQGGMQGRGHGNRNWGQIKAENAGGNPAKGETGERAGRGGPGGGGMALPRLPELFTLAGAGSTIEVRDSANAVVDRILLADSGAAPAGADGVPQFAGVWQGSDLQITAPGRNGATVTQTYELADNGKTLRVTLQMSGNKDSKRPPRAFTRVYHRVSSTG